MSRTSVALATCALLAGCVVSFDGYRALEETNSAGNAGNPAGGSARGGTASGGKADGGDGATQGGVTAEGGAGDGGQTPSGGSGDTGGSAGTGGGSGTAGTAGAGGAPETCPGDLPGPPSVEIPKPDGGFYCVDRTEVTNGQYAQFLATSPDPAGQDEVCSWNDSFDPQTSTECDNVESQSSLPVTCVDWCDAKKFCEWAGKELCGAITGGPVLPADFAEPGVDAWFSACSEDGMREFPYGNDYESESCIGIDSPFLEPVAAGMTTTCQGGYPGLYDMSGNVSEWENSCTGESSASDECLHRGGSLYDADTIGATGHTLRCNSSAAGDNTPSPALARRDLRHSLIGFRCCLVP